MTSETETKNDNNASKKVSKQFIVKILFTEETENLTVSVNLQK